jgi:hypothetical protein
LRLIEVQAEPGNRLQLSPVTELIAFPARRKFSSLIARRWL